MVRSLHQLFLLSQTDRCWPFGATKTEKQTWGPSYNPFIAAPVSNQKALSSKQPQRLVAPALVSVPSSPQLSRCGGDSDGIHASLRHEVGRLWRRRVSFLPAALWMSELVSPLLRLLKAPVRRMVPSSSTTGQSIRISQQWQRAYGCSLRGLDSDGAENSLPQWQNQLRAVNYSLLQSVRQCERNRTRVSLHRKCI